MKEGEGAKQKTYIALADVAQWFEGWPVNQWVTGLISSLGHVPALQARSPEGGV